MMLRRGSGFTLIEVLIALSITVLIATLSFTSLTVVLDSVESVRKIRVEITEVNRLWSLLSRDLRHIVARPVRNEFGDPEPSFWGGAEEDSTIHFTRVGWHNPNNSTRSNMQRVSYRLEDDTLWRDSYPVLDRTSETKVQSVALLEGVLAFEMAFLPQGSQVSLQGVDTEDWAEDWNAGVDAADGAPPRAVEMRLELEGWGELRRLYELPAQ